MAKSGITDIQTTQTFQNWFDKTNELVQIVRDDTLTATSGGDVTTGNAILDGNFTAVNLTSNNGVVFTDTIQLADTGNLAININSPILINGSNKIAATYQFNSTGAQTRYTDGSLSWDVGLKDATDYSFIIDSGAGDPELELTTDGTLLVTNLTVSGNTTFADGSIKIQAQEAFEAGNGIIFVANTAAELVTIKVDDSAVVRADQDSTMSADLTIENHDLILETSIQGGNGRIRGFNQAGNESLRLEAHNDGAVIGAVGLDDSNQNHNLKFYVFNNYYATLDTDMFTIDTPTTINGRLDINTENNAGIIGTSGNANSYIEIVGANAGGEIRMFTPRATIGAGQNDLIKAFELNNLAGVVNTAEFWGGQVSLPYSVDGAAEVTYTFRNGSIRSGDTNRNGSFTAYKGDGTSATAGYSYGRFGTSETDGYANNMVVSGDLTFDTGTYETTISAEAATDENKSITVPADNGVLALTKNAGMSVKGHLRYTHAPTDAVFYFTFENCVIGKPLYIEGTGDSYFVESGSSGFTVSEAVTASYSPLSWGASSSVTMNMAGPFDDTTNANGWLTLADGLRASAIIVIPTSTTVVLGFDAFTNRTSDIYVWH